MSRVLSTLLARLRAAAQPGADRVTDSELLGRFVRDQEAAAFELLFWRHAPMVWGVCRRLLGDSADAEDAFQATFVVLARRAAIIGRGEALAGWLHAVAWRTACNARTAKRRRTAHERAVPVPSESSQSGDPVRTAIQKELKALLDRELLALPEKFRLPVILCDLESLSNQAAAAALNCPIGTLNSRLARGREKLRARLLRRGVSLTAVTSIMVPLRVSAAALGSFWRTPPDAVRVLADGTVRALALGTAIKTATGVAACLVVVAGLALGTLRAREDPAAPPALAVQAAADMMPQLLDPDDGPLPLEAVARIGSTRFRHGGDVTGLAYSPDNRWLASISTTSADATARVWDASTGKERLRLKVALLPSPYDFWQVPRAIGFSADSQQLLVVDVASIRGFDIHSGAERFAYRLPESGMWRVNGRPCLIGAGLAPDAKTFVLAWNDGRVEIRDVTTGIIRHTGEHPFKNYTYVTIEFSADGRRFLTSGRDNKPVPVPVFDTSSGRKIADACPEGRHVQDARFLPDGENVALLLGQRELRSYIQKVGFYSLQKKTLRIADADSNTRAIAVSPDGKLLFAGNGGKQFSQLIDVETGKEIGRVASSYSLGLLAFSPDGKWVAGSRHWCGAISVWEVATRRFHPNAAQPSSFHGTVFARDSRNVILPHADRAFVDWRTGAVTRPLANVETDDFWSLVLSPNGRWYALPDQSGAIRLLDAVTGQLVRRLTGPTQGTRSIVFSRDSRRLASRDWEKIIRVWDVASGRELTKFNAPECDGLQLSAEGRVLATNVTGGNVVYTWDVDTQRQLARLEASTWFYSRIALSPDGRYVAGGGGHDRSQPTTESAVTIWDAATGQAVHTLPGHANQYVHPGADCEFSPDGRLLVTGDNAGRLRLWEVATGQELHRFDGHHTTVTAHFSPDGRLLVAASEDAPCFIWDVFHLGRGQHGP